MFCFILQISTIGAGYTSWNETEQLKKNHSFIYLFIYLSLGHLRYFYHRGPLGKGRSKGPPPLPVSTLLITDR